MSFLFFVFFQKDSVQWINLTFAFNYFTKNYQDLFMLWLFLDDFMFHFKLFYLSMCMGHERQAI